MTIGGALALTALVYSITKEVAKRNQHKPSTARRMEKFMDLIDKK